MELRGRTRHRFAVVGWLPVAIGLGDGADFNAPLGRAVIGGLITSTILTLLVIPTFYEIVDDVREGGKRLVRRMRGKPVTPTEPIPAPR